MAGRAESLTEREAEVLRLVAQARSNAEIARELFIGEATVKTHVSNVLQKLGARDRVHAAVLAHQHGLRLTAPHRADLRPRGGSAAARGIRSVERMLQLRNLDKSYGTHRVLADVSFDVLPGRLTGFVGGNGAGKTTTMRIVLGVLAADAGTVTLDGGAARRRRPPPLRLHARGARALPEDEGARADRLPRAAARLLPRRPRRMPPPRCSSGSGSASG